MSGVTVTNNGVYSFRSVEVKGEYLDICGGKSENDTDLQTYPANFGYAQQFKAISKGDGFLLTFLENDKKVIDRFLHRNGAGIWDVHGKENQIWNVEFVGYSPLENEYAIVNKSSKTAITSHGSKASVTCEPFDANSVPANQRWKLYLES